MAGQFEVIDTNAVDVSIEVRKGGEWEGMDYEPGTDFVVKPPLTIDEHMALIERTDTDFKSLQWLAGSVEHVDVSSTFNNEGELGEAQVAFGVELAKGVLSVKEKRTAKVCMNLGDTAQSRLVIVKSETSDS